MFRALLMLLAAPITNAPGLKPAPTPKVEIRPTGDASTDWYQHEPLTGSRKPNAWKRYANCEPLEMKVEGREESGDRTRVRPKLALISSGRVLGQAHTSWIVGVSQVLKYNRIDTDGTYVGNTIPAQCSSEAVNGTHEQSGHE